MLGTATAVLFLMGLGAPALASAPLPQERPGAWQPSLVPMGAHTLVMPRSLRASDAARLEKALAHAERGRWQKALAEVDRIRDGAANKLIRWMWLTDENNGASFAQIAAFREQNPDWPDQRALAVRAEEALLDQPMSDAEIIAWFAGDAPVTGEGKLRLGAALIASDREREGEVWIQRGWIDHNFTRAREKQILAAHRRHLPDQAHEDRLERLLWERRYRSARRMAKLVGGDSKALAEARIKLMSRAAGVDAAIARVPAYLQADPGLLFDRAHFKRKRGRSEEALPLLLTAPTEPHLMVRPDRWWVERRIAARKALEQGLYFEAYALAKAHGMTEGVDFAEGEFLAGWIALQHLDEPGFAAEHFANLEQGVKTPISKARAAYWQARTASADGRSADAGRHYARAAEHSTTFYGQLAIAALATMGGDGRLALPAEPQPSPGARTALANNEQARAIRMLHDAGRDRLVRKFTIHLAKTLDDTEQLATLSDLAMALGLPNLSVRVAKVAARRGILLARRAYPLAVVPKFSARGPFVEPALVYGLSRQESEFDPKAVSHAGARGLMQLMPSTAKIVARQVGVSYSRRRLLADPAYNAMLGTAHLGDLLGDFTGSYVMTIAAYNAGKHRVEQWVDRFGDPRSTAVDPIDWVESIPFSETRNYVQRVLENTQVYRKRLDGADVVRLEDDLHRNTGTLISEPAPPRGPVIPMAPPAAATAAAPPPPAQPGTLGTIPLSALSDEARANAAGEAVQPAQAPATEAPAPSAPHDDSGVPSMAPVVGPEEAAGQAGTTASIGRPSAPAPGSAPETDGAPAR